jgi:hypothetical protein
VVPHALAGDCRDEVGKAAFTRGFKKVVVKNVPAKSEEAVSFTNGSLVVHWAWGAGDDAFNFSAARVRDVVEAGL